MKILHISVQDYAGAGNAARWLHLGLKSLNFNSKMLVLWRNSNDADIAQLSSSQNIFKRLSGAIRRKIIFSGLNFYKDILPYRLGIFTSDRAVYNIIRHPLITEADIINLHLIATMVDHLEFFSGILRKPIVWTLHDMNSFTGGCHYSGGCLKYQTGCGACPQLRSADLNDASRKIFQRKQKAYQGRNMHIIAPSRWMADCARGSLLFKEFRIDVIPSGLSLSIFTRRDKRYSRNLLGLPQDRTLILFGADKKERKGLDYLLEAMKLLQTKAGLPPFGLVIFGRCFDSLPKDKTFPIYPLGHINDELLLSFIYSAADLLVMPSLQENLGQICLEAMACSVPVVGFNIGGNPDLIRPGKTGLFAELKNANDLAQKIEWMVCHPRERQEMGKNARELIEEGYSNITQAGHYRRIYESFFS